MIWIIEALLLATMIGCWIQGRDDSPALKMTSAGLAVAAIAVALYAQFRPDPRVASFQEGTNRLEESVGFELGQAVAQAFPQGGDVLVLLRGLPAQFPENGVDAARIKGLRAGFGQVKLQAIPLNYQPASDLEAMEMQNDWVLNGIPVEKINEWFTAHHGAVGVVSFVLVGTKPQAAPPTQFPPLFLNWPPILAPGHEGKQVWLDRVKPGALEAVVVMHSTRDWTKTTAQGTLPELFQESYGLITPANVTAERSRLTGAQP